MKKNEFIKQIRQKYKMSQKKFAEYLEVSKSLIEKVEMGKIPATPENKYVKAVCALEGLDNEIFKFDEITDEILREYELTKFSKAFRKFLYFYYGDFWNVEIENKFYIDLFEYLKPFIKMKNLEEEVNCVFNETNIPHILTKQDIILDMIFYINIAVLYLLMPKQTMQTLIDNNENKPWIYNIIFLNKVLIISYINSISSNMRFSLDNFSEVCSTFLKKLQNIDLIIKNSHKYLDENKKPSFQAENYLNIKKLKQHFIKKIDCNGLSLTIENIKKLKKQKELEKIKDEVIPAPTDPKDKQICELLQYAPPAFKDKIIEKLLKFKDEVEDI